MVSRPRWASHYLPIKTIWTTTKFRIKRNAHIHTGQRERRLPSTMRMAIMIAADSGNKWRWRRRRHNHLRKWKATLGFVFRTERRRQIIILKCTIACHQAGHAKQPEWAANADWTTIGQYYGGPLDCMHDQSRRIDNIEHWLPRATQAWCILFAWMVGFLVYADRLMIIQANWMATRDHEC